MNLQDLKVIRKSKGWSQMDVCLMVGVSLPTYQVWERGISKPNPENYEKLVQAFKGVSNGK